MSARKPEFAPLTRAVAGVTRLIAALLFLLIAPAADAQQATDSAGDRYEIRLESRSQSSSDNGSRSSSSDTWTLIERVITVRGDGVELEYDLPPDTSAEDRARSWQFPARVLKTPDGALHLLNASEMQTRIAAWLRLGDMTEEACGHWVFTWTAFKIECDPQSVIGTLEPYDLRVSDLRDGASYRTTGALAPAALHAERNDRFVAEMQVDPESVRRQLAESDVVVAQIMRREPPLTFEAALQDHAPEQISGTIVTTFETQDGRVIRRTQVTQLQVTGASGVTERRTTTMTVQRRRVARR